MLQKIGLGMLFLLGTAVAESNSTFLESPGGQSLQAENPYRQTRFGWQDSRQWESFGPPDSIPAFHPIWASLLLAIAVTGMLVWSMEEDEWANWWRLRPPERKTGHS